MSDIEKKTDDELDAKTEQQIRLEKARKDSFDAEIKLNKQQSKESRKKEGAKAKKDAIKAMKKYPKIAGIIIVAIALVAIVVVGVALPLALDNEETQYLAESNLKEVVDIENLSTISYTYCGIAEKSEQFLWMETGYRVRYEAHIRAHFDMSAIEFAIDQESKLVTAYLPNAEIGTPVLDETEFGYLPESASANMKDVLALCKEDAANEINTDEINRQAIRSLQDVVKALTMPLLGDDWQLEFKSLSEYSTEGVEDEAE